MAWLIEAYEAPGAIALAERYSFHYLETLFSQTAELRKSPEEREKDRLEEFVKQNKDRTVEVNLPSGKRKYKLSSFMPIG